MKTAAWLKRDSDKQPLHLGTNATGWA